VHLSALLLQLLDPRLQVRQLALQHLDLIRVRAHRLLERARKKIRHGLDLAAGQRRRVHRRQRAVSETIAQRALLHAAISLLRRLLARVHLVLVGVDGTEDLRLLGELRVLARGAGAGVVVLGGVGARVGRVVAVVDVRVAAGSSRQALEEDHSGGEKERKCEG